MPGPFYFAWVDAGTPFDPVAHAVEDDDIFAFGLEHNEGDFATLTLTVRNPRIGLLAPGRKVWAWFSWFDGAVVRPLFFGRLVGLPDQLTGEAVQFNFIARPEDYAEQKAALAATMRTRPYWDGIWFSDDDRDEPDNVLEARAALWHFDRITHEVSASDMVRGEDGTLNFDGTHVFYDSVQISYAQNALRKVKMTATVSWDQAGSGSFPLGGGLTGLPAPTMLHSRTGEGLQGAWPKPGTSIGGGWTFGKDTRCVIASGKIDSSVVGQPTQDWSGYLDDGLDVGIAENGAYWLLDPLPPTAPPGWQFHYAIPNIGLYWGLSFDYEAKRRYGEVLTFTLVADVQAILTAPDDQETLALDMKSSEVSEPVDAGGVPPLSSPKARSYFATDRGAQSIEYLIAVARAHLLARGRAVNLDFEIPFPLAVASNLSCRKNASLADDRLPGAFAAGKIASYRMSLDDGRAVAAIQIGCSIGRGGEVEPVPGEPEYSEADYVGADYQHFAGRYDMPFPGDVTYQPQDFVPPNDDGLDFDRMTLGGMIEFQNDLFTQGMGQFDALGAIFKLSTTPEGQLTAEPKRWDKFKIIMRPVEGGPFETHYAPDVSALKVPKTIDLEAAA